MASFFQSLALFYGVGYLYAKETKKILYTTLVGSLASIVLGIILVPFIGLFGAAIASLLGFFIMFIMRLIQTRKYFTISFPINKSIYLISGILVCDILNYFESFYLQISNIVFALLIFYFANRKFIQIKVSLIKIKILNKYHDS